MSRLAGKVAIITGAARGIGEATARLFVAEGAKVVLSDVLDAEGARIASELGDTATFQHHDVSDEAAWHGLVAATLDRFGAIDILINNAGILKVQGLLEASKQDFERTLAVNLIGVFLGIKAVGPGMIDRGKGSIVNISSVSGMIGQPRVGAYAASKWGLRGLTRVAALELGPRGVRVNSVHPGGTQTVMGIHGLPTQVINRFYASVPLRRIGQPEEIARAALFLASDEASYVCGAELLVDGGMIAGRHYTVEADPS
jgi:3alpha(or 20beta)-hydroxysteroid dehydrogenase